MAVFVLIHGGGHGGWCYKPLAKKLRDLGHQVYAPSLSGMGENAHQIHPQIDLDVHIEDIARLLFFEDLQDAILVGHSYGGMVMTGAADRAADRVGHRVYLDAAYPKNGESLHDHAFEMIEAQRHTIYQENGVELVMKPNPAMAGFMGITDPETVDWANERMTAQPWACFAQKLNMRNEEKMRAIPESHLICTSTIPGREMEQLKANSDGRVWDVDTGHDLMLTEPQWVAEKLHQIAQL